MSTWQCGRMSDLAYSAPNIDPNKPVGGYHLVGQTATARGYNGAAFYNPSTNTVVIASGGTASIPDIGNDVDLAAGLAPAQAADAKKFTDDTLSNLKAAGVTNPDITFTGHSLGGHLANALQDAYAATTSPNCLVTLRNSMTLSVLLTAHWEN